MQFCNIGPQLGNMGNTVFFKHCREEYGTEFMSSVDRVCKFIDNFRRLRDISETWLKVYTGKNNRWEKAAKAAKKYGSELFTRKKNEAGFLKGADILEKVGVAQATSAIVMMDKFHKRLHSFHQLEVKQVLDQLNQLESLRKEMEKTAKKAGKSEDEMAKNTANQAKETHDRYLPTVDEGMKKFLEAAVMMNEISASWIEAEKEMCVKSNEIIAEFKEEK